MEVRPEREERRSGVEPSRIASIHRPEGEQHDEEERVRDDVGTRR